MNITQTTQPIFQVRLKQICDLASNTMSLGHSCVQFGQPLSALLADARTALINDSLTELSVASHDTGGDQCSRGIKI